MPSFFPPLTYLCVCVSEPWKPHLSGIMLICGILWLSWFKIVHSIAGINTSSLFIVKSCPIKDRAYDVCSFITGGCLADSAFWLLRIMLLWTAESLCGWYAFIPSGYNLSEWNFWVRWCLCSAIWGAARLFCKVVVTFSIYSCQQRTEVSNSSRPCLTFIILWLFGYSYPNKGKGILLTDFDSHFSDR